MFVVALELALTERKEKSMKKLVEKSRDFMIFIYLSFSFIHQSFSTPRFRDVGSASWFSKRSTKNYRVVNLNHHRSVLPCGGRKRECQQVKVRPGGQKREGGREGGGSTGARRKGRTAEGKISGMNE